MTATAHIPAWKRLGLKLKYAKDIPAPVVESSEHASSDKKRKIPETDVHEIDLSGNVEIPKPAKKLKLSKTDAGSFTAGSTKLQPQTPKQLPRRSSIAGQTPSPNPEKRKSVSFASDAKTTDGDSVKQLYDNWLSEQAEDFDPSSASEALRSLTPLTVGESPSVKADRTSKKSKPSKSSRITVTGSDETSKSIATTSDETSLSSTPGEASTYIPPFLEYLTAYHTSRSTWKFNKSKQTQILKHIFDTTKIPPEYEDALKAYLSGLTGFAARKRLRDQALKIRQDDEADLAGADEDMETGKDADVKASITPSEEAAFLKALGEYNKTIKEPSVPKDYVSPGLEPAIAARLKAYKRYGRKNYTADVKRLEIEREENELRASQPFLDKLIRRKRAEMVLWTVDKDGIINPPTPSQALETQIMEAAKAVQKLPTQIVYEYENGGASGSATAGARMAGNALGKRKRKRKRRTGVPDDDSSSSESSSSSSEDEGKAAKGGKQVSTTSVPDKVESSSQSSSSSDDSTSSEEDGEDDGDASDSNEDSDEDSDEESDEDGDEDMDVDDSSGSEDSAGSD